MRQAALVIDVMRRGELWIVHVGQVDVTPTRMERERVLYLDGEI
jgi:hypothetical protein